MARDPSRAGRSSAQELRLQRYVITVPVGRQILPQSEILHYVPFLMILPVLIAQILIIRICICEMYSAVVCLSVSVSINNARITAYTNRISVMISTIGSRESVDDAVPPLRKSLCKTATILLHIRWVIAIRINREPSAAKSISILQVSYCAP